MQPTNNTPASWASPSSSQSSLSTSRPVQTLQHLGPLTLLVLCSQWHHRHRCSFISIDGLCFCIVRNHDHFITDTAAHSNLIVVYLSNLDAARVFVGNSCLAFNTTDPGRYLQCFKTLPGPHSTRPCGINRRLAASNTFAASSKFVSIEPTSAPASWWPHEVVRQWIDTAKRQICNYTIVMLSTTHTLRSDCQIESFYVLEVKAWLQCAFTAQTTITNIAIEKVSQRSK